MSSLESDREADRRRESMKVVLVGGGNITRTRHIPAVKALGYETIGVVGLRDEAVAETLRIAGSGSSYVGDVTGSGGPEWLAQADLFIIGTPPQSHAQLVASLSRFENARVLSEKPFIVSEADEMLLRSIPMGRVGVMHNFQFASGFLRAKRLIADGRIGTVRSIRALQWSTKDRRLPEWYRDLPLGLFWDESAHFLYLVTDLVGELTLDQAWASPSSDPLDPTPCVVGAFLNAASGVAVEMSMNFEAAISEWGLVISGTSGTIVYDLFRDIAIILPHDGLHTARQILATSALATAQHWYFTFQNGQRYLRKRHLYGIDEVIRRVATSENLVDGPVSAQAGLATTSLMAQIASVVLN